MKVIEDIRTFTAPSYSVVTSGTFDGVHEGHQKILRKIARSARKREGKSVVVTFWPHPRFVLGKSNELKLLTTFEEKAHIIGQLGIDFLVKIPFTKEFSNLTSAEFIDQILVEKINTRKLVIGYDHRFGKNREGSFEHLKENGHVYGFEVEEIPRLDIEDVGVSSTKIRQALQNGEIHEANHLLGRPFSLTGFVMDGDRIGRSIGFPTANIDVPENYKLIPADGSYAVLVRWQNHEYKGMLNIGQRPTVSGQERRIEVNLFNFDRNIYNERLTIRFIQRLREERKFANIEELKNQLNKDKEEALKILENNE